MKQIALDWGPPPRRTFTVSELAEALRGVFLEGFTDIWVAGEIVGAKLAGSGHYYFTLKDEAAQIRCACYKMTARYLKFKPVDGVVVLARGRVDLYDARGDLQLIVEAMEPQGYGALQFAFEQLKKKLAEEGLFAAERKRPLPKLPERIGIVTSLGGVVIRDILQILERRCPGRQIRVYPAQVQGDVAAGQIARAVDYFSASGWAEVVIVARGGGSLEDLWAFNEERVARAIAACTVPVISAVGHETDFTIADFVADFRAPTPSAAAEIVIATRASLLERLDAANSKLMQSAHLCVARAGRRLAQFRIDPARIHRVLGKHAQGVDEKEYRLRDAVRAGMDRRRRRIEALRMRLERCDVRLRLARSRQRLEDARARLILSMRLRVQRAGGRLGLAAAHLSQLSPVKILDRGYAIVQRDGKVVRSAGEAPVGSEIRVRLAEGELGAKVFKH